ncbi:DUF6261 family protein [Parabacteroides sp. OttesenSCG-928-G07]|nr:DUF6261 family protein [Parabacteroides sp. OttesenSCG-928-G21]MDL2278007.1 DUF6261 family protein [Parabacteroides sp. OttesenSCG-928-G07]
MKSISSTAVLRRLQNAEHFQVNKTMVELLEEPVQDFTELTASYALYKQLFEHEDLVFKHNKKMEGTQGIQAADKLRDNEYISLRSAVKSGLHSIDPEIRAASEALMLVFDNYKNVPHRSYNTATAFVTNLVKDLALPKNQVHVTKLSLAPVITLLDNANKAFEQAYVQRNSWVEQQKLQGNMEMARPPVDEAFNALVYIVNSLYATNEVGAKDADKRTKLAAIIDGLNAELHNMERVIAYRKPGSGTDPDPDPHPEPEPGPIVPYRFTARSTMLVNGRTLLVTATDFDEFAEFIDERMIGGIMDFHPDGRSNRFTLDEISYDETDSTPMGLRFIPTDDQDLLGTLSYETYTVEVVKDDVVVLTIDEVKEPEGLA